MQHTSLSLLEQLRADDQDAWQKLIHLYGPLVQRWCRRSGLRDEDVADIFQETFRAVAGHLHNFAPTKATGSFRSWLRTIVRTKVADHFRKRSEQALAQGGTEALQRLANTQDPLIKETEEDVDDEKALLVQQAMELIKPEFTIQNWQAFEKVALQGHSATEIAEQIGVNAQAIRQANYRIRRRLRVVLKDLVDEI